MKKHNIFYGISIIFLLVAFFLIIEYPNWNRAQLIAGFVVSLGFIANFLAFEFKGESLKKK